MTINSQIIRILEDKKFDVENCVTYLLSIYFNLRPTFIDELTVRQVGLSGIARRDYENGSVNWTVPLFKMEQGNWGWIDEYRQIFSSVKAGAGGNREQCVELMQKVFTENPVLTSKIVMDAARAYVREFTVGYNDLKYLQRADYFIEKKYFDEATAQFVIKSRLLQYADINPKKHSQIKIVK